MSKSEIDILTYGSQHQTVKKHDVRAEFVEQAVFESNSNYGVAEDTKSVEREKTCGDCRRKEKRWIT